MIASFQFKQFAIQQDKTAMKVGTDGVLLGAWLTIKEGNILDIGTGTGLIALMLAQRTKTAVIDAIDIEQEAFLQASANVKANNWANRISVYPSSLQNFKPNLTYDLIVSNPPFFINSTKTPNRLRNTARHNDTLTYNDLIEGVNQLLKPDGLFSIILPTEEAQIFVKEAEENRLHLHRKCLVTPNPTKAPKRVLMEFSFLKGNTKEEELTIETNKRHQYTKEYITLTQDFYLKF